MKNLPTLRLFYPVLLMLLAFSCQQPGEVTPSRSPTLSVAEAKTWFADYTTSTSGRVGQQLPRRTPQWNRSQFTTLSDGTPAVAVPLVYEKKGIGTGSMAHLLFFRKKDALQMQVMKLVSDPVYFYRNKQQIHLQNFSGLLTMHDWQEQFLYGARYENGRTVGRLTQPRAAGRVGLDCQMVEITHYVRVCVGDDCATSVDYVEQYLDCSSGGGAGGSDPFPSGPIGGGPGIPTPTGEPIQFTFLKPRAVTMPGQQGDPVDLKKYLDCFGEITDQATYEITVYVDEPYADSGFSKFFTNVGHAFIGLKKQHPGTGTYVQQVFGFYPMEPSPDVLAGPVPSKVVNNGNAGYTVSVTFSVNAGQFQNAVTAALNATNRNYNLVGNNCVNFVFDIVNAAGLPVPQNGTMFPWGGGFGYSPGQLGSDLHNSPQTQANTNAGNAPGSAGPC